MKKIFMAIAVFVILTIGPSIAEELVFGSQYGMICLENEHEWMAVGKASGYSYDDGTYEIPCVGQDGLCWAIVGTSLHVFTGSGTGSTAIWHVREIHP